jgi:hypothetical protein
VHAFGSAKVSGMPPRFKPWRVPTATLRLVIKNVVNIRLASLSPPLDPPGFRCYALERTRVQDILVRAT